MPEKQSQPNPRSLDDRLDVANFVAGDEIRQWRAFCYVADELTDQQRIDFEAQLADDTDLQLAVADAVALGRAVFEAEHADQTNQNGRVSRGDFNQRINERVKPNAQTRRQQFNGNRRIWASAVAVLAIAGFIALGVNNTAKEPSVAVVESIDLELAVAEPLESTEAIDTWLDDLEFFEASTDLGLNLASDSDQQWDVDEQWDTEDSEDALNDQESMEDGGSLVAFYSAVLTDSDQADGVDL